MFLNLEKMSDESTFADLAAHGIPFPLTSSFELVEIPIPIDVFDALISRYLPGRIRGWVDFDREEETPVRIKYKLHQSELGEIGTIELFKTGNNESAMFASLPPLSSGSDDLRRRRKEHNSRVIQALFSLLAQDSTWQKYWKKAKENWRKEKDPNEDITMKLLNRLDSIHIDLGEKINDLKLGQAAIYKHIDHKTQLTLQDILEAIRLGRIEQGYLQRTLDAVRRVLKHQQNVGSSIDERELKESLDKIYQSINSDLNFHQGVELTIPIIPLLLQYKVDVGAGVDLASVWAELVELVNRKNQK